MNHPGTKGGASASGSAGGGKRPDQRLGRNRRLVRSGDFRETFDQGHKQVGRFMILWVRKVEGASLKLGVVTSRKVGNAVKRVRVRRRLREVFRRHRDQLQDGVDVVLVGRASAVGAPWPEFEADFLALARRARIWTESP